jgi:hypothetical protein
MATYYGTYGQKVQYLASDPSDPQIGQVWYNSTSATLKLSGFVASGTWASGGNVNTQQAYGSGAGTTQNTSIKFGGSTNAPGGFNTAASEKYDGTAWTSTPSINNPRIAAGGSGNSAAALMWCGGAGPAGYTGDSTEKFDGTSWTTSGSMTTPTNYCKGFGTQTATIFAGGSNGSPTGTYSFNGSTWTTLPATIPTNRYNHVAWGTSTAGLVSNGETPGTSPTDSLTSLSWNGSTWTSAPSTNNTRSYGACFGTNTSAIASCGGGPGGATSNVELYNGSSWSTQTSYPTPVSPTGAGGGTNAAGVQWAGNSGATMFSNTNEWSGPGPAIQTVTVS